MENNNEKQLKVSAIKNGTVLDHIPSGQARNSSRSAPSRTERYSTTYPPGRSSR